MDTFYQALPYILIFAQCVGAAMVARRSARLGRTVSKWKVILLAPLPIPVLIVGFAFFAFKIAAPANGCAKDTCAADTAALNVLIGSALALYLIGMITGLLGYRGGKASLERRRVE